MKYWITAFSLIALIYAAELKGYVFTKTPWGNKLISAPLDNVYVGTGLDSTRSVMNFPTEMGFYALSYTPQSSVISSSRALDLSSSEILSSSSVLLNSSVGVSSSSSEAFLSSSSEISLSSSSDLTLVLAHKTNPLFNANLFDVSGRVRSADMQGKLRLYTQFNSKPMTTPLKETPSRLVPQGVLFKSSGYYPQVFDVGSVPDTVWMEWDPNSLSAQWRNTFINFDSLRLYSWEKSNALDYDHLDSNGIGALLGQKFNLIGDSVVKYEFYQDDQLIDTMYLSVNEPSLTYFPLQLFEIIFPDMSEFKPAPNYAHVRGELQRLAALFSEKLRACVIKKNYAYLCDPTLANYKMYDGSRSFTYNFDGYWTNEGSLRFSLKSNMLACVSNDEFTVKYTLDPIAKSLKDTVIYNASPECLDEIHF